VSEPTSTLGNLREVLRKIACRRPADRHMPNAFLRCRDEAREALKLTERMREGDVSDGHHTFDELYEHRCTLFAALMISHPACSWRSRLHADGSSWDGWWIGGIDLHGGTITYHLPEEKWALLDGTAVRTLDRAPEWDGHTSEDVVRRLTVWCERRA
jgi:hypothetical protein